LLATNVNTQIQGQQNTKSTSGWIIKYSTQILIASFLVCFAQVKANGRWALRSTTNDIVQKLVAKSWNGQT
jgi:hypothetical protein